MTTLLEIVKSINSFSENDTIYATNPWVLDSESIVIREPDNGVLPEEVIKNKMLYFLDISLAKDFINDFKKSNRAELSIEDVCTRLIDYATNDA